MIVAGLPTSLPFHSLVLAEPDFVAGRYDTDYVGRHWDHPRTPEISEGAALATALVGLARLRARPRPLVLDATPWSRSARLDMLR
jgi:acetyl/propionyl-CoA carboxylase alpha subunit